MEKHEVLFPSVTKPRGSEEPRTSVSLVFTSAIMRHVMLFFSLPVEGIIAPFSESLSCTAFPVCHAKVGQMFRYFVRTVSEYFECLLLFSYQWLRKKAVNHRHYVST